MEAIYVMLIMIIDYNYCSRGPLYGQTRQEEKEGSGALKMVYTSISSNIYGKVK